MDQCDGSKPITYREAIALLKELRERLEDELHSQLFLHLDGQQAAMYQVPEKEWGEVIRRFGKVRKDVEEGIRCFALERYAASVFHVMLIAEFGVIEVAKLFGVEGDKPGWGALDRLQRVSTKAWKDKTAIEQKHSKFLDDLLPFALAIRNSWRHKLSHVDNKIEWADTDFSQNVAQDILSATRGFMEKLARDLPK